MAERAFHLPQGLAALRFGFGGDEIGHALDLGQVDAARLESAPGKLARLRQAQTRDAANRAHDRLRNGAAAMQVQLGHILPGETRRSRKPQHNRLVEGLTGLRTDQPAQAGATRRRQLPLGN